MQTNALKKLGATAVYLWMYSWSSFRSAFDRINSSAIEELAMLNTIPLPKGCRIHTK